MRRFVISAVGVTAMSFALTPAFAADLTVKPRAVERPAPVIQTSNWTGGQIGGNAGGSIGNNNFVEPGALVCNPFNPCSETPFSFSNKPASFVGGIFLGYRWQMGNTVFGVEGDATWQNLKSSVSQSSVTAIPPGAPFNRTDSFSGSVKQGWEGSLRARYGWLVTPMTLLYATGGVSFGEVSGSFSYTGYLCTGCGNFATVSGSGSWNDTRVGWTVGGGVESDVSGLFGVPGVKVRAEYRFTDYGGYSKDIALACTGINCPSPSVFPSSNAHIEVSDIYNHKFLVGLGIDF
jgi:outer membrane immunogenic protein